MTPHEEDMDAAIWLALKIYKVTCDEPLMFIESLRVICRAYAAGDSETLTRARRMVLHEATRPRRRPRPALAEGSGHPPAPELSPPGSAARPLGGATLSTGHVIPLRGQASAILRPQAVDNPGQQAARLLENLHERHTGKMTRR